MTGPSSNNKARSIFGLNPIEGIGVIVVGIIIAAAGLMWLSLKIAGWMFTGAAPKTSFASVLKVFAHPLNPERAFPVAARVHVPGAFGLWIVFLALGAGIFFAGLYLYRRFSGITRDPNAVNWAKPNDLKPLIVRGPMPGRLIIGKSSGKLLATEPRQSVIILGPTQTGKTTGLAVPAILEWKGPVLAASVKNDLVKDTIKWRAKQGDVWLFDPTRSTGFDYEDVRAGWSPISASQDWGGARKVASWLCKSAKSSQGNLSDGDFWYAAAEKLMAPFLFAAAQGKRDMAEVLRWIDANEEAEVMGILARAGVEEAALAFAANMHRDERTRNSIFTTAETILGAYADPLVAESAEHPAIFPENLLNGQSNTLYVCAPSHEQDRLQPVFTALVSQMKTYAYELAGKQNKPVDPALLLVIDEAANIAPLSDLDAIASTAAGIGIQLVTVFQDFAQIEARYDKRARTVVNNYRAKVV
ncbi:MAG: type IV secretory system conjugative DNA transfer family protein, partial [Acidimicrobiia bacterium]